MKISEINVESFTSVDKQKDYMCTSKFARK